jgi:glycosyltransferase involved in cell wall biosynthesis
MSMVLDELRQSLGSSGSPADPHRVGVDELELSVVMPCLNEALTVGVCVAKARRTMDALGVRGEVVVVDNGSTDGSREIAEAAGARVVSHDLKGYGHALRRGFAEARGRYIIMGDCDDSYDFTDLERFLQPLRGGADLVMGNRFKGQILPGAMPWHHRYLGNPVLSWFLNFLFRTGARDCHCGMRGFTQDAVERMGLQMPGMELASEMVIKSAAAGLRIVEIPITLSPDGRDRPPHLRSFRDGWRHLRFILMCCPAFLFLLPGLLLMLLSLAAIPAAMLAGYGQYTDKFGPNFLIAASFAAIAGANLMLFGLFAKLYTGRVDPVFADPKAERLLRTFSMESGLLTGLGLLAAGGLLAAQTVFGWWTHGTVDQPALWILGGTLATLGLEAVFASFLLGILQLPQESRRSRG